MKRVQILGHIHTLNDDSVIDRSLGTLLAQTYPVDEIVLVDNGSTDNTLNRPFPKKASIIRHSQNLGTSGAVAAGFRYALDHEFDWIWVFDADTAPRADALEYLMALYESFDAAAQAKTRVLSSLPLDVRTGRAYHGRCFTRHGSYTVVPKPGQSYYEFDASMWTGCLFKLEAVKTIGLPSVDYVLDRGEFEYSYRGMKAGFKGYMHLSSIVDHNIDGQGSLKTTRYGLGPFSFPLMELPPIRIYYVVRNTLYFWMYEFDRPTPWLIAKSILKVAALMSSFLVRPFTRRKEIIAAIRGVRDGFGKHIERRH